MLRVLGELNKMNKKLIAVGLSCLALGAGAVALHDVLEQPEIVKEVVVNETIKEVPVVVTKNVTVEVPVEVEKLVEVDNGNLDLVLEELYDNDGSVEYLLDDLDDDELDLIVERIIFANEAKALAISEVEKEGIELLDDEIVDGTELDDRDVERFKVYDDADEVVLEDIDYDNSDVDVIVEARFEQDDIEYLATYSVEIKDGEVEDMDLVSVSLR